MEETEQLRMWRKAHPQATFSEIEQEVDRLLRKKHQYLLEEYLQESEEAESIPLCPTCHQPMQARGNRTRQMQSQRGPQISFQRRYWSCPECQTGFSPPR